MKNHYLDPPFTEVRDAVRRAFAEDLSPLGDLSAALVPATRRAEAAFVSREVGVLAGRACVDETFRQVDPDLVVEWQVDEGGRLDAGTTIATVSGPLTSVLVAERTALNFVGHLSGIASNARRYVDAATGGARVWDTRKTIPGLRAIQKAAVRAGGAHNHRGNLSDWVMLKDNHLTGTDIAGAVALARDRWPGRVVHVECDRLDQLDEALAAGADAVLLDNMTLDELRSGVARVDAHEAAGGARPLVEASGGVTLDTVGAISETGVDMISSGALTNSAPVLDIGLDIETSPEDAD